MEIGTPLAFETTEPNFFLNNFKTAVSFFSGQQLAI